MAIAGPGRCRAKLPALRCCFAFRKADQQDETASDQEESLDELSTAASTPNEVSEADGDAFALTSWQPPPSCPLEMEVTVTNDLGETGAPPVVPKEDWWREVSREVATETGLEAVSTLMSACVIHEEDSKLLMDPAATRTLYEQMLKPMLWKRNDYVAVWLGMGPRWLVYLCEATGDGIRQSLKSRTALKRIKLILRPVQVRLPFPSSPPKDAEFVGPYFGEGAQIDEMMVGPSGSQIYALRVNLYGNWLVKLGLQHIGLQLGNCLDLLVIDWPSKLLLASIRLTVTKAFKDQQNRMPRALKSHLRLEA